MAHAARAASRVAPWLLLVAALPFALAQTAADGWQEGTLGVLGYGSSYDSSKGSCGYGALPDSVWPYGAVAAIDPAASPLAVGVQQGCGVCIEVECTDASACDGAAGQSVVVLVTDYCSGCGADIVHLSPTAFSRLMPGSLGRVPGRFRRVNCSPLGGIAVHVDQFRSTQGGWVRLALTNVAGSGDVESIELTPSQSPNSWRSMQRSYGATWSLSNLPSGPFDLRATDGTGQQIVARQALQGQVGNFPTDAQFVPASDLPTATTTGTSAAPSTASAAATATAAARAAPKPEAVLPSSAAAATVPLPARLAPLVESAPARQPVPLLQTAPVPSVEARPAPAPMAEAAPARPARTSLFAPTTEPTVQLVSPAVPAASPALATIPPLPAPAAATPPVAPAVQPGNLPPTAFSLPQPAESAPTVIDTRPPRPPGVGPSITPAPVVFTTVPGLPTLPKLPPSQGPATRDEVRAAGNVNQATCSTLGATLAGIPQASNFTQLMRGVGLDVLLRDKNAQVTLLVPINSAFNAAMDARPLRNESTLTELILNAPEIQNPLVGYHVLPGLWPSYTLQPGAKLNTSDTIDKVNRLQITAVSPTQLQGIGTSANILQGDITTCGPSIIHIVDQVLLPFRFDQAAVDAITGTTAPGILPAIPRPESVTTPAGR